MGWIEFESFRVCCPDFTDVFVRRETAERLQATCKVICGEKVAEMCTQLIVAVVVESFDRGVLDCSIPLAGRCLLASAEKHSFDLPVRPGMAHFGQSVFDPIFSAAHTEHMR